MVELENKLKNSFVEFTSLKEQISDYEKALNSYRQLYRGELSRYQTGESTIFLVNTRESKLLEATQKLIELKAKYQKAHASIYFAAGMLI
jgi:outer membrane protein TolC